MKAALRNIATNFNSKKALTITAIVVIAIIVIVVLYYVFKNKIEDSKRRQEEQDSIIRNREIMDQRENAFGQTGLTLTDEELKAIAKTIYDSAGFYATGGLIGIIFPDDDEETIYRQIERLRTEADFYKCNEYFIDPEITGEYHRGGLVQFLSHWLEAPEEKSNLNNILLENGLQPKF